MKQHEFEKISENLDIFMCKNCDIIVIKTNDGYWDGKNSVEDLSNLGCDELIIKNILD